MTISAIMGAPTPPHVSSTTKFAMTLTSLRFGMKLLRPEIWSRPWKDANKPLAWLMINVLLIMIASMEPAHGQGTSATEQPLISLSMT